MKHYLEFWKDTLKSAFYKGYSDELDSLASMMLLVAAGWGIGSFVHFVYRILNSFGG